MLRKQYIGKTNEIVDVSLHGNALKQVKEFTYLGSVIASNGTSEKDIDRRINLARAAFNSLKKIWAARDISKPLKVRVYESLVLSILLYGSETWTMTELTKGPLRSFEMICLRKIMGISKKDHYRNTEIKKYLNIEYDIVEKIQQRQLRYFGHITRMEPSRHAVHCSSWRGSWSSDRGQTEEAVA